MLIIGLLDNEVDDIMVQRSVPMDKSGECRPYGEVASDKRLRLLSKELEEALNQFLSKVTELEKLLPLVEE
jgi:hypothetical protein